MTAQIDLPRLPGESDDNYDRRVRSERARLGHQNRKEKAAVQQPTEVQPVAPQEDEEHRGPLQAEVSGVKPAVAPVEPGSPQARTFHFLEDGLTVLQRLWYRGEEVTLIEGSDDWERTVTQGRSVFDLSENEQIDRYEKVMFREGRWPGRPRMSEDEYLAEISQTDDEETRRRLEKRRQRELAAGVQRS